MRLVLAQTFIIQSIGVALMLATTLIVSRLGGPAAQGSFAFVKSVIDLEVAIFSLGLPSAIVFMLNSTRQGYEQTSAYLLRYMVILLLILPVLNIVPFALLHGISGITEYLTRAVLIGIAASLLTAFSLFRSLLLVHTDGPKFSFVSNFQWLIIAACAAFFLNRNPFIFEIAYAVAGALSMMLVLCLIGRYQSLIRPSGNRKGIDFAILRQQSVQVLAQTILFSLQPFITNAFLMSQDPTQKSAGLFNVASLVITLPNLLVALVAPVLFNRWSKSLDWEGYLIVRKNALWIGGLVQVIALLSVPLIPLLLPAIFGKEFLQAAPAIIILILSVFAVLAGRVITPALQGLGRTDWVTLSCMGRAISAFFGALAAYWCGLPILYSVALGWCTGEYVALSILLLISGKGRTL